MLNAWSFVDIFALDIDNILSFESPSNDTWSTNDSCFSLLWNSTRESWLYNWTGMLIISDTVSLFGDLDLDLIFILFFFETNEE